MHPNLLKCIINQTHKIFFPFCLRSIRVVLIGYARSNRMSPKTFRQGALLCLKKVCLNKANKLSSCKVCKNTVSYILYLRVCILEAEDEETTAWKSVQNSWGCNR